jgi:hypothetical protein
MDAIVRDPPQTVGELANALGLRIEELVPHGMFSMGSILGHGVSAEYEWDMYHEAPVETLAALAQRRLIAFRIHLDEPLPALAFATALGEPAPTAHTVDVPMASWRMELRRGDRRVLATLAGPPGGAELPNPPAARAAYVGEDATIVSFEVRHG